MYCHVSATKQYKPCTDGMLEDTYNTFSYSVATWMYRVVTNNVLDANLHRLFIGWHVNETV